MGLTQSHARKHAAVKAVSASDFGHRLAGFIRRKEAKESLHNFTRKLNPFTSGRGAGGYHCLYPAFLTPPPLSLDLSIRLLSTLALDFSTTACD